MSAHVPEFTCSIKGMAPIKTLLRFLGWKTETQLDCFVFLRASWDASTSYRMTLYSWSKSNPSTLPINRLRDFLACSCLPCLQ